MDVRGSMAWGHLTIASVAALLVVAAPANAADKTADQSAMESMFDVAFGVGVTSDYISRGYTQTDHKPAIQPWVELDYGMFYAGYWGSNVAGGDWEHDLSIGLRPEVGPVSFDFGYVRYLYNSGDCCGELYAKASASPADPLTLGASIFFDPGQSNTYVEGNAAIDLPHNISLSAAAGVQTYGNGDPSDFSWNAGASWSPFDWLTADLRYYGGPMADRVVLSLSVESSLSALRGGN